MIMLITWALLGLLLGASSFVLVPWMLALLGGVELRDRVGRYFIGQTMTVLGDAALFAQKQGGVALGAVSYDADFGADKASVAGQVGHVADDLGLKSRLAGKPFGLSLESHPVYISPLFAEFASAAVASKDSGRLGHTDGGFRLDFEIPDRPTLPTLRDTYQIFDGDARLKYGRLAESWAKKSQEKFGQRVSIGQTMLLIGAFVAGSGMAFLTMKYGGGGGGGGVEMPIQIAGGLL